MSSCHDPGNSGQSRYPSNFFLQVIVSLYSSGCPGTHSVDQVGLKLSNAPAFASQVPGLKACATTARLVFNSFCCCCCCFYFHFLVFHVRVSLCSPGCPGTHSVDQVGLKLRNPPACASQALGLKACTTTAWLPVSALGKHP